ncbi:DUF2975 domain-containing protein [Mechercharimyces sp. CAU 1602]|uniref:DUF2975 domain-containing protein n=1 Tax=Mechercharimyces sp. CAU 1602 TaxID=2973933 RepID=UPI002161831E|nr:DUF2975 domain-containing protein [Mechercharimyces sp. CAU 1602]MCS1350482.1 DUF2975 domain-containing protein [Mechercharimyces sp. CAU 1602]
MSLSSTNFLRVTIFLAGTAVLLLCIFALPSIAVEIAEYEIETAPYLYPILIGMYVTAIPFFLALFYSLRLLRLVDRQDAFSKSSVTYLRRIKFSAVVVSLIYLALMPCFYFVGEIDDAPGVIVIGMVMVFTSFVIAVFTALLQKILKHAIEIKSEHDLTV